MTDLRSRVAALSPEQRAVLEARVADLAAAGAAGQTDRIPRRDPGCPTPLSFAQQREWALERFRPSNNIITAVRLEGDVDLDLLGRVMTEITARHEVLRSTVETVDGVPVQVVHPVEPVPVPVVDLAGLPPEQQREQVRRHHDAEVMRPFSAEQVPRMRATVLRLGPETCIGLLVVHHAASDGWSTAIIAREVAQLYRAFHAGRGAGLAPLPIQYGDFALWQRERLNEDWMAAELAYWREALAGIPPRLALPTDRPTPTRRTFDGAQHEVSLPRETSIALNRYAESAGSAISMLMLAAASVMLHRYTGQQDLVFGSAITGRNRQETEALIGCFANVLPWRMRISRDQTLREVVDQARDVVAAAFDHQDLPFDRLIEELAPGETSQTPLIRMMINVLTMPGGSDDAAMEMPGLRIAPEPVNYGPVAVDLILLVRARPESISLHWHYSTELFDQETVARLADQFSHLLDQVVDNPTCRVAEVPMRDTVAPAAPVPAIPDSAAAPSVLEELRRQVALAADAPAVVCDGVATSFGELNQQANRVAHRLRSMGVGPEVPVGILLPRSPDLAVAILAVLKAGGAFVPLDPQYPSERVSFMLSDARAPVLITNPELAPLAAQASARPVLLTGADSPSSGLDGELADPPPPTAPAYVCYTSGSTGQPKGAVIEHRSLATFAQEVAGRLQLGAGDRFLQFASPGFDVLVEELFPVWRAGGAVVIPPPDQLAPGLDLLALIEREQVSVMELPAAYWHEWVRQLNGAGKALPRSLRLVIVGAERVLPERLAMWQELGVPLLHVYGITETTVSSTFFRLPPGAGSADLRHLPIGTALPSVRLRILDSELRPVPAGGVGELYLSGVSLARGYLHRPGLTAERFIADPDPAHPGERAYRTGDLVRQRADGNLEFVSRADTQINIRGFRVEPAEIESAVCRHPQVAQAVVTHYEPVPEDRRLVAYLVPQPRTRPNLTDLRRFLARELPPYLVPATFVVLESLPVTENGKVDRDRLPEPGDERPELAEELVPARTPLEKQLAEIVANALGVTMVGADDNFFDLGGDSILAIQVVARAQEEGIGLSPLDLFEHPTVALLARAATDAAEATATDAAEATAADAMPMSPEVATSQPPDAEAPEQPGSGTPPAASDFPLARMDQGQLDTLLSSIADDDRSATTN